MLHRASRVTDRGAKYLVIATPKLESLAFDRWPPDSDTRPHNDPLYPPPLRSPPIVETFQYLFIRGNFADGRVGYVGPRSFAQPLLET